MLSTNTKKTSIETSLRLKTEYCVFHFGFFFLRKRRSSRRNGGFPEMR